MVNNLKYWLYDRNEVSSWYFWESPQTSEDKLISLGIIDKPEVILSWLDKDLRDTSFIDDIKWWFVDIKDDFVQWAKILGSDIRKIETWRLDETTWLLWSFFKAWQSNIDRIQEFNKAVDRTWWWMFDKIIWAWLSTVWAWVDFTWDVVVSWLKTLAPEWLERATKEWLEDFSRTDFWAWLINLIKVWWEKFQSFKDSSDEANRLWQSIELLLPTLEIVTWWAWWKIIKDTSKEIIKSWIKKTWDITTNIWNITKEWIDVIKQKAWDIELPKFKKTEDDILLKNLWLDTEKGMINWVEVDVPKTDRSLSEKIVWALDSKTDKELAWRAVSPRTIWKNAKQKLKSVADVEKNTRKFYENIRTWVLEWDISTLENSAQTIVNNIDIVWARIGNAVKKVDWEINIDNNTTDSIIKALWTKWAEVSPATPILKKFFESLWSWKLSIEEAYELKKAYSNEVTKLYKSWDAWTKQYKALSDWVQFLNTKIDEIIETKLWVEFANDKILFRELKLLVDDMVASALVEGRKSPDSFAEQIGKVESLFSPVNSVKQKLIKDSNELNKRGWAWKELIRRYDEVTVRNK